MNDGPLSDQLKLIVTMDLGAAPTRYVADPQTGAIGTRCLLVYRGDELTSWSIKFRYGGGEHMVEFKASGAQCVM